MQVTNSENEVLPVWIIDLLKELLVDQSCESLVKTCFETLWWLVGDFDDFLQQTERESVVRLTGDPESEVFVGFSCFRIAE